MNMTISYADASLAHQKVSAPYFYTDETEIIANS